MRDARGRFGPGNRIGRGNPQLRRVARLRAELLRAITPEDIRAIFKSMLRAAIEGDTVAAREILDRTIGKAGDGADLLARIEELEYSLRSIVPQQAAQPDPKRAVG